MKMAKTSAESKKIKVHLSSPDYEGEIIVDSIVVEKLKKNGGFRGVNPGKFSMIMNYDNEDGSSDYEFSIDDMKSWDDLDKGILQVAAFLYEWGDFDYMTLNSLYIEGDGRIFEFNTDDVLKISERIEEEKRNKAFEEKERGEYERLKKKYETTKKEPVVSGGDSCCDE